MKTTVIIHIYNEEYLLPYWLNHHKDIFDHGIIINYHSTDRSLDICHEICPTWQIIQSKNAEFDAYSVDREVEEIEKTVEGFKIVLNVTEFLVLFKPLKEIIGSYENKVAINVQAYAPYSDKTYDPQNAKELFGNLLNEDVKYGTERGTRILHNHTSGCYIVGRHNSHHATVNNDDLCIIWFGFYPFNDKLICRKIQIKNKISQHDIQHKLGFHHLWDRKEQIRQNAERHSNGKSLKEINQKLYEYLFAKSINV